MGDGGPDDFGLTRVQTLARVSDPSPASDHSIVWRSVKKALHAFRPELGERVAGGAGVTAVDPSDETATHAFESVPASVGSEERVRIGARLLLPADGVRPVAGVVSTHGYGVSKPLAERDGLFAGLLERGVAVLNIRVRGFAGSRLDTGDWCAHEDGWICRGLDGAEGEPAGALGWSYVQGVADVVNGVRALRWYLEGRNGTTPKMMLHGESFGGGLAVAAAALLTGRERPRTWLDRVVLGLPTMGDWPWRLSEARHAGRGSGDEVWRCVERSAHAGAVRARLRIADSVVHAARLRCPVLCKLAERDEVVPAPTASAVFNAVGSDPGQKWRFIVPYGHAEMGVANAREHASFDRLMVEFLDPSREPVEGVRVWEEAQAARRAAGADPDRGAGSEQGGLFGSDAEPEARDRALIEAYRAAGRTLDDLPYTESFESIYAAVGVDEDGAAGLARRDVFHRLHNLRKAGKLPRMGRAEGRAIRIQPEEEERLTALVIERVGALGKRDRLPFTDDFDSLLEVFNAETGRSLGEHELWRVVAKLAK